MIPPPLCNIAGTTGGKIMDNKEVKLTASDMEAISLSDSNYINNKGVNQYMSENYAE